MALFKKKMTEELFVDFLLELNEWVKEEVLRFFYNDLNYEGDEKRMLFEARTFSLWMTTLCTPPQNKNIKDMFHAKFYEYLGMDQSIKQYYYEEIDKRYRNYYGAYRLWTNNPQNDMIGLVMIEIIYLQNPDFKISEYVPIVDGDQALKAFILFGELLNSMLNCVGELKKEYNLDNILMQE